jgi:hypothetical protein
MFSNKEVRQAVEYFKENKTFFHNEYIGYPNFEILISVATAYLEGKEDI